MRRSVQPRSIRRQSDGMLTKHVAVISRSGFLGPTDRFTDLQPIAKPLRGGFRALHPQCGQDGRFHPAATQGYIAVRRPALCPSFLRLDKLGAVTAIPAPGDVDRDVRLSSCGLRDAGPRQPG